MRSNYRNLEHEIAQRAAVIWGRRDVIGGAKRTRYGCAGLRCPPATSRMGCDQIECGATDAGGQSNEQPLSADGARAAQRPYLFLVHTVSAVWSPPLCVHGCRKLRRRQGAPAVVTLASRCFRIQSRVAPPSMKPLIKRPPFAAESHSNNRTLPRWLRKQLEPLKIAAHAP